MRRMFQSSESHAHLASRGWASLPSLTADETARLFALAVEHESRCMSHAKSCDTGFDELWGNALKSERDAVQDSIASVMAPALDRWFEGYRAVLYNLFTKRRRSPRSVVRYHFDFAIVDERGGDSAIQLWIPLVDATPENGALIVREWSHRRVTPIRPHDYVHPASADSLTSLPRDAVRPPQRAGQGVAFLNRTMHGSPPNLSADDRPAVGVIVVPDALSLVHWVCPSPERAELWALSDADFRALRPGCVLEGARLVETVYRAKST